MQGTGWSEPAMSIREYEPEQIVSLLRQVEAGVVT